MYVYVNENYYMTSKKLSIWYELTFSQGYRTSYQNFPAACKLCPEIFYILNEILALIFICTDKPLKISKNARINKNKNKTKATISPPNDS